MTRTRACAAGFLVGLALAGAAGAGWVVARHPLSRTPWAPGCWELTRPAMLGAADASAGPGPFLPAGTELWWDGEVGWVTVHLEGRGFARCATRDVEPLVGRSRAPR